MSDVAVIGAGPVGCTIAIALARRDHGVQVFESRPDPRRAPDIGGRSINLTISERGWEALREVGLEEAVRSLSMPLSGRLIHGEDGTNRFQPYTADGDAIWAASRTGLTAMLSEAASDHDGVTLHFGHRCTTVDVERRTLSMVRTDGGRVEAAPAHVLAADGAYSTARRGLLRSGATRFIQRLSPIFYKELRVPPRPDGGPAFEDLALHLWPRGDLMIVGFPNVDRSMTISVFMPFSGALSFELFAEPSILEDYLRTSCPDLANSAPEFVADFFRGPPAPLLSSSCASWIHEDWLALIGDAAHALVPFLGQGLNAGLEDCTVLARCIDAHGQDWTAAFAAYQDARQENAQALVELAEDHFEELARSARDPRFVVRKALEAKAHRLAPDRFVPLYTMVAFHPRPYVEIRRRRAWQEQVLDAVMVMPGIEQRWDSPEVENVLRTELGLALRLTVTAERSELGRTLVVGWFSFELMGSTAGDQIAKDVLVDWLRRDGVRAKVAMTVPAALDEIATGDVVPEDYDSLVFVCGPIGDGPPLNAFLDRFNHARRFALNVSLLQDSAEWNPFEGVIERDSERGVNPDLTFAAPERTVPVVGMILVGPQEEYPSQRHSEAEGLLREAAVTRGVAAIPIDTRLDLNRYGLRTPAEVESAIARMDAVLTTRLHGAALALRRGVAPVALDSIPEGSKLHRQMERIDWPLRFRVGDCTAEQILAALDYALTPAAHALARACAARARAELGQVEAEFFSLTRLPAARLRGA